MPGKSSENSRFSPPPSAKARILNNVTTVKNYLETIRLVVGDNSSLSETMTKIDDQLAALCELADELDTSN
jgi:hypothetical protein